MNRTPLLVGAVFLAVVGAGAIWLGPRLLRRSPRTSTPVGLPPARDLPRRSDVPRRSGAGDVVPASGRASASPTVSWRVPRLLVTGPDGAPLPDAALRFAGLADARGFAGRFVGAKGFAWARIARTDSDGVVRVRLAEATPDLILRVREADGRPAPLVPVTTGGDGFLVGLTDPDGRLRVDSIAAGVLRLNVGAGTRAAPLRRVRMGVDRDAEVVLEPGWDVAVRVIDEAGRAISGAEVAGHGFDGPRTGAESGGGTSRSIRTGDDGVARLVTRVDERLAIVVTARGFETTTVRAPFPDPMGPLSSRVTVRLRAEQGRVGGTIQWPVGGRHVLDVRGEPAVLAPVREWLGREDVGGRAAEVAYGTVALGREESPFELRGLDPAVPWRITVRGPVVAEDHVVSLDDPAADRLELRPEAAVADAGPVAESPPPPGSVSLRGRVTDAKGAPLRGVTVGAEGRRALTDADGLFVAPGFPKGVAFDIVYGWLDGADAGGANPAEFAPWFQVRASASDELLALTLPRAASVRARLTEGLTGKPLSWARLVLLDGEGNVRFDAPVATSDGRVLLEGLVPGAAGTFFAFAPGLRREVPITLRAGDVTDAGEIGLVRGGRVAGVVKDKTGVAVAGAAVAVMEDGRLERGGRASAYGRDLVMRRTVTDVKGAFVLEGLDTSRPAAIGAVADGYAPAARRVLWSEGEDASVSVTMLHGGSVRLQLFDPEGGRVSGAFVELEDARTGVRTTDVLRRAALGSFVAATDDVRRATAGFLLEDPRSPGAYRIGPVESGPYDVVVTCPGFRPQRAKFTVPDAEPGTKGLIPTAGLDWRLELSRAPDGR